MEVAQAVYEPCDFPEQFRRVDHLLCSVLVKLEKLLHCLRVEDVLFRNQLLVRIKNEYNHTLM